MARKSGLGRGLDALFADNAMEESAGTGASVNLNINDIEPNREQARRIFDEDALSELAESIRTHGVIQPLLVRPMTNGSYQLIAGERRWRASRMAGLREVPVVIRELTDADAMAISLIENLQREDLNPVEEAQGFASLMEKLNFTQEQAAQAVGKSRAAVANALRLLKLPDDLLDLLQDGMISTGHARALLSFSDAERQQEVAQLICEKQLSVRQVEALARAEARQAKVQPESRPKRRASYFDEVELALAESLGRKVKVFTKGAEENGSLSIDFLDQADLERIVKAFHALAE